MVNYIQHTTEEYNNIIKLRNKYRYSPKKLNKITGIKFPTIARWIYYDVKPIELHKKHWQSKSDLRPLLNETPKTYYWLGFLIADGHFDEKSLAFSLKKSDINQINKFKKFLKYKGDCKPRFIHVGDVKIIKSIRNKFKITNNKTTKPCSINHINDDNSFISFVIGYIDGDGCIGNQTNRKDCYIRFHCHKNWKNNIQYISNRICKLSNTKSQKCIIGNDGYTRLIFTNFKIVKFLKKKAVELKLPFLKRKWNKINEFSSNRNETSDYRIKKTKEMLKQNYRNVDIAKELDVCDSAITLIIQRNNLKR